MSSLAAIGLNALFQAASLVVLARTFGPSEYSIVVLATAAAVVAAEFVGLGSGDLLIREVSRDRTRHSAAFGRALLVNCITLVPICAVSTYLVELSFGIAVSVSVLLALVSSEIIAIRFVWLAEQIAIAHNASYVANVIRILTAFVRVAFVCVAVFAAGVATASGWAMYAVVSSVFVAIGSLATCARYFGRPELGGRGSHDTRLGLLFTAGQILRAVQQSLDKFVVASVAGPATIGAFGVGSRASQLGSMPSNAITRITYPLFFERGASGLREAMVLGRELAPSIVGIGFLSSIALACFSFAMPYLFGPAYAEATSYVLALAPLPMAVSLQNLGGNILAGADLQAPRIFVSTIGVGIIAVAAFGGSSWGGVIGAIAGYVIGNFILVGLTWAAIFNFRLSLSRHEGKA